jgi:hypothetical protein
MSINDSDVSLDLPLKWALEVYGVGLRVAVCSKVAVGVFVIEGI